VQLDKAERNAQNRRNCRYRPLSPTSATPGRCARNFGFNEIVNGSKKQGTQAQ